MFTIRRLLAITTFASIGMAILRRPLTELAWSSTQGFFANALDPFRHLAWMAGFETQYSQIGPTYIVGFYIGFVVSVFVHIALISVIYHVCCVIWQLASTDVAPPPLTQEEY